MRSPQLLLFAFILLGTSAAEAQIFDARKPIAWPSQDVYLDRAVSMSAASVLADIPAIHAFVRDSVATEVYEGALRGARGTLIVAAGNSLDKSLLLGELLARKNRRVRIVQGELSDDQVSKVLSRMDADLAARANALRAGAMADLRSAPGASLADEDEKADLDYVITRRSELMSRIAGLWADLAAYAGLVSGQEADQHRRNEKNQREQLRKIARTHFWVQVQDSGGWMDLDPTIPLPSGHAATGIGSRYESGQLPDSLRHSVEFEVRSTFQQDGERRLQTNLIVRSHADQLGHLPIVLVHPGKGDPFASLVRFDALLSATTGGVPFTPVLFIGSQPFRGIELTMGGWSDANAFFGGSKPAIVDEQFVIRTQSPDAVAREFKRWIFNRATTLERTKAGEWALEPLVDTKEVRVVDAGENVTLDLMPQALRGIWAFRVGVGPANADLADTPLSQEADVAGIGDPSAILNLNSILESAAYVDIATRVAVGGIQYYPVSVGPTLSAFVVGARAADSTKVDLEATAVIGMDLIDVFSMPLGGGDYQGHGLLSLAIEQAFVELLSDRQGDSAPPLFTVRNVLLTARKAGIPLVEISSPADLARLSPSVRAVVERHPIRGNLLVPRDLVDFHGSKELAWLNLDTHTRYAIDRSSLQAGAALVEYIQKNKSVIRITETLCRFRQCLAMAKGVAAGAVKILRGKIEMRAIVDVATVYQDASDCAKVKLTIPVYKVWKKGTTQADRDIRNKMTAMQEAARRGELKVPSRREYSAHRERNAGEFAGVRESQLGRKRGDDEAWDHRIELGCGGKHEASNVFPLNASYNSAIGNFLGRACQSLCNGTLISQINFKYILPGKPGLTSLLDVYAVYEDSHSSVDAYCSTH